MMKTRNIPMARKVVETIRERELVRKLVSERREGVRGRIEVAGKRGQGREGRKKMRAGKRRIRPGGKGTAIS